MPLSHSHWVTGQRSTLNALDAQECAFQQQALGLQMLTAGSTSGGARLRVDTVQVLHTRKVSCVHTADWGHLRASTEPGFLQSRLPWGYWCTATILSCCLYRRCCSRVRNGKLHVLASGLGETVVWEDLCHGLKLQSLTGRAKTSQQAHLEWLRANVDLPQPCTEWSAADIKASAKKTKQNQFNTFSSTIFSLNKKRKKEKKSEIKNIPVERNTGCLKVTIMKLWEAKNLPEGTT